jgi:hypothetical protein
MISCLHDHFLDDQLLPTPHLYFLYLDTPKDKEPSNRDLMNALKSTPKQLKTSGDS